MSKTISIPKTSKFNKGIITNATDNLIVLLNYKHDYSYDVI